MNEKDKKLDPDLDLERKLKEEILGLFDGIKSSHNNDDVIKEIHSTGNSKERIILWERFNLNDRANKVVSSYRRRVERHIYDTFTRYRVIELTVIMQDLSEKLLEVGKRIQHLTHAEDCEDPTECPVDHYICEELLNPFSAMYWKIAHAFFDIGGDLNRIISSIDRDKINLGVLFGLTAAYYKFESIKDVTKQRHLFFQHPDKKYEEYERMRGFKEFISFHYEDFSCIGALFENLQHMATRIALEMQEIAEEGLTQK